MDRKMNGRFSWDCRKCGHFNSVLYSGSDPAELFPECASCGAVVHVKLENGVAYEVTKRPPYRALTWLLWAALVILMARIMWENM